MESYIEEYGFQVDDDKVWSLENIKTAYGKLQRMLDKLKLPLAVFIVSHMRKRNEINARAETDQRFDIEKENI